MTYCCSVFPKIANDEVVYSKEFLVEKPVIGYNYHISWARKKGMVWKLVSFDETTAYLVTPKTHKPIKCKLSELRETNKRAFNKTLKTSAPTAEKTSGD